MEKDLTLDELCDNICIASGAGGTMIHSGEMSEWFKEAVLKTAEGQTSVGSNPTLSAIY